MIKHHLKLCLITHALTQPLFLYKQFILEAIAGGVTLVQLREKSKNLTQIYYMALELKNLLSPFKIPLIINDHIDIAKEIDADGLHLGQSDLSPIEARKRLGPNKIIGLSIETLAELNIANQLNCIDYVAASAVFPSKTKYDCKTIWGLEGLRQMSQVSKHPVVAIGGVCKENIKNIIQNGATGVAVINAIHCQSDPKKAAAELITEINLSIKRKIHV